MQSTCCAVVLCGLLLNIGYGQPTVAPPVSQLEALEHFIEKPTARITWSKEVERIDSAEAHAVITALIVNDATQTPPQMRGIRIDLTSADSKDQYYTSEELLERLIGALDEISTGPLTPFVRERNQRFKNFCFGSGVFWQQPGHAFTASQCVFGDWSGLSVTSRFRFTDLTPAPFSAAIARARDELKKR